MALMGLFDGSTAGAFEAILAALFAFLAWWIRDMSVHTRGRMELMDAERWALRADLTRLLAHIEDQDARLQRLEDRGHSSARRPPD